MPARVGEERGARTFLTSEERQRRHYEQTGEWLPIEQLPKYGTGLGNPNSIIRVATKPSRLALQEANPQPEFVEEECYWPSTIGVDEKFTGKLYFINKGAAGECWVGMRYKGEGYVFMCNDHPHSPVEANQAVQVTAETTIREFLDGIEEFKETKTIEITFMCGFFADETYYYTDTWTARTYVKVPAEFAIPWLAAVIAGLMIVGGTGIAIARRKK